MSATREAKYAFRWRSVLGVATGLFLLNGALSLFAALLVPISLHLNGPAAVPGLVLSESADAALLGRSVQEIGTKDPRLGVYLVSFMDTMCAQMMIFAIAYLAIAWFAFRRAEGWAFWALAVSGLAWVPYYFVIASTYGNNGVSIGLGDYSVVVFALPALIGAVLGWWGLRGMRPGLTARPSR